MKFGIIAAVLVVYGFPMPLEMLGFWRNPQPVEPNGIVALYFLIGWLPAAIISIAGIVKDKYKYLAVLTLLLCIAWIIFLCWLLHALQEPPY